MCTTIQINGEYIDGLGELWGILGQENVVMSHKASFEWDDCLCHVDVQATAAKAGYSCRSGWDESSCDFILTRR
jgi:hypothetical protein